MKMNNREYIIFGANLDNRVRILSDDLLRILDYLSPRNFAEVIKDHYKIVDSSDTEGEKLYQLSELWKKVSYKIVDWFKSQDGYLNREEYHNLQKKKYIDSINSKFQSLLTHMRNGGKIKADNSDTFLKMIDEKLYIQFSGDRKFEINLSAWISYWQYSPDSWVKV